MCVFIYKHTVYIYIYINLLEQKNIRDVCVCVCVCITYPKENNPYKKKIDWRNIFDYLLKPFI